MATYGSYQTEGEIGRAAVLGGARLFRASHLTTRKTAVLKVVRAAGAKQEPILAALRLQQALGDMPASGWLPVLDLGTTDTECYAVFESAEPQLVRDIDSILEPSAPVVGQTCVAILQSLIQLNKHAPGRRHGNLKPANVLFRQTPTGEIDYSCALLSDILPLNASGQGSAQSDLRALGILLYQFIRSDKQPRQVIPDDRKLWREQTEKQDPAWRLFVSSLMSGKYDDSSLESVLRIAKRLSGEKSPVLKWVAMAASVLIVAGTVTYMDVRAHPPSGNESAEAKRAAQEQADKDYETANDAFKAGNYAEAEHLSDAHAGEARFAELKKNAEDKIVEYAAVQRAAQEQADKDYQSAAAAFKTGNYAETERLSDAHAGEARFAELRKNAEDKIGAIAASNQAAGEQADKDYQSAEAAFKTGNYAEAERLSDAHAGEARFDELKKNAEDKIGAIAASNQAARERADKDYEAANNAFQTGNYAETERLSDAHAGDPRFDELKKSAEEKIGQAAAAQRAAKELADKDYETANNAFQTGNYAETERLSDAHAGDPRFDELKKNAEEKISQAAAAQRAAKELADKDYETANNAFQTGNYAETERLSDAHAGDPRFDELKKNAEEKISQAAAAQRAAQEQADKDFETANNAFKTGNYAETERLSEPHAGDARFDELKKNAEEKISQAAEAKRQADQQAEAKRVADEKAQQEAEAKRLAEQQAEAKRLADEKAQQEAEAQTKADQEFKDTVADIQSGKYAEADRVCDLHTGVAKFDALKKTNPLRALEVWEVRMGINKNKKKPLITDPSLGGKPATQWEAFDPDRAQKEFDAFVAKCNETEIKDRVKEIRRRLQL